MYKSLVALTCLGLLAGCTSDWDPSRASATGKVTRSTLLGSAEAVSAGRQMRARRRTGFASLPDRGELLAYDRDIDSMRNGAYSLHPVRLSEEHAFRAAHPDGVMVMQSPEGRPIRLEYERHVEHPDGNWTWIGRDANGADAIMTFGEKAVFGSIPNGKDEPLRLTIENGRSWLVATDRSRMADGNRAVTRSGKPDYLIPPELATAAAVGSSQSIADLTMEGEFAEPLAVTNTVDLVLGYTPGFVSANGNSDSGAVTKLNFLVQVANAAYTNSQIDARLRIVRTVSVNYPDATLNATTLEELTGYRAGSGPITPNPAFNGLRAARDQYGGDLVTLVRDFRTPENDGCGIAWLLGAGQSGIDAGDAPFGYAVVSDGRDILESDGREFFCRDDTLAHEIGHNMGQAHNSEDSTTAGVHAYSYGYRESSPAGFYTVMAYRIPDSSQTGTPYFANPNVFFDGRPTGVTNVSDNARSMNQVMSIVAGFRATIVANAGRRRSDLNGDTRDDILWHNPGQNRLAYWLMSGTAISGSAALPAPAGFSMIGTGDYNGDGRAELLWSSGSGGGMYTSTFTGSGFTGALLGTHDPGWTPMVAGDINGDGRDDILWRNPSQNRIAYWFMNGSAVAGSAALASQPGLKLLGTGDFDGDGRAELLWSSGPGGGMYTSTFTGSGFTGALIGSHDLGWIPVATGDLNGDGRDDILWHNPGQNRLAYWLMNGTAISGSAALLAPAGFTMIGAGDFNGDARVELLWSSGVGGGMYTSTFNGSGFNGALIGSHDTGWIPSGNALRQ